MNSKFKFSKFIGQSILGKLLLPIIPLVIIGLVASKFFALYIIESFVIDDVQKNLTERAWNIMERLDLDMHERHRDIEQLAINPIIINSLRYSSFKKASSLLSEIKKKQKVYSAIELYDDKGNLAALSSLSMLSYLKENGSDKVSKENWFQKAIEGSECHSKLQFSDLYNSYVFYFLSPIRNPINQKIIGILRGVYAWKNIYNYFEEYQIKSQKEGIRSREYIIVDNNQIINYHSNKDKILKPYDKPNDNELKGIIIGQAAELKNRFQHDLGLSCIVTESKQSALSKITNLKKNLFLFSIFLTIGLIIIITLVARTLLHPINDLSKGIRKIIKDSNYCFQIQQRSQDELGQLVVSFNLLTKHLNDSIEKEQEAFKKREEQTLELKVINDQMKSSEEQLKRANKELKSSEQQLLDKEKSLNKSQVELAKKLNHLERFNKIMVGRELEMIRLKEEINKLLTKAGDKEQYKIPRKEKEDNG